MQQVINRTLYDTESSERIARYAGNTDPSDFYFLIEELYKTAAGDYFIHGQGGAQTKYAKRVSGGRTGSEEIREVTEEEALEWCEDRSIDGEIVADEFQDLIDVPDSADD